MVSSYDPGGGSTNVTCRWEVHVTFVSGGSASMIAIQGVGVKKRYCILHFLGPAGVLEVGIWSITVV